MSSENSFDSFDSVDCPVADLQGMALDYAVAIVEGGHSLEFDDITWAFTLDGKTRVLSQGWGSIGYQPSIEWAQGGPIIEREGMTLRVMCDGYWLAELEEFDTLSHGHTPLVAAMRCHVAGKLGDSVKIPRGLIEG